MRKLIAIVSIVAVVCLGLAIVSVVGDSTNVEPKRQHSARPTPGPGWLILNGRLINPPYEVIRKNDTILVNGLQVYPKIRTAKNTTERPSAAVRRIWELGKEFNGKFSEWVERYDQDSLAKLALKFYRDSPLIDSAFLESSQLLAIYYSDWPELEVLVDLDPPKMDPPPEGWAQTSFERRRKRIESALNYRALVIFQNGLSRIIPFPRSEKVYNEIRQILASTEGLTEQAKRILPFVSDQEMADSIAINFLNPIEE